MVIVYKNQPNIVEEVSPLDVSKDQGSFHNEDIIPVKIFLWWRPDGLTSVLLL